MHEGFLNRLGENPACLATWLVYADWLDDRDDPTGPFVRESLEITAGLPAAEFTEERLLAFADLYQKAHPDTRDLMGLYRSSLPTRFRVLDRFLIGHNPPREMFGYARTVLTGVLEAGRVKLGANLGVGTDAGGRPRMLQMIGSFSRELQEASAGGDPVLVGLGWLGHLPIEPGVTLTEVG